ncbi:MAG: tRNA pseudouridine(55) synthase TruB [Pseudomonadota bacterium]
MPRRRKATVHGWLILDKPVGLTSTQAVGRIKRIFETGKAGHAGTLDPLASGCLPIALGEATKTVPYVVDGEKVYRFTVRWGAATNTDDSDGEVTETSDARPNLTAIDALLPRYTGVISQIPPKFSAIKVDGARAYDLARDGEVVELAAREVEIDELVRLSDGTDETVFECRCGKGTYVRAIARDMGRDLGCFGHITALRRVSVGPFEEVDMISLESLDEMRHKAETPQVPLAALRPVETALDDIPALAVSRSDAARLANGQPVLLRGRDAPILEGMVYAMLGSRLVALAEAQGIEIVPRRIFHLPETSGVPDVATE